MKFLKFSIELPVNSEELAIVALWEMGLQNAMVEYLNELVLVSVFLPAEYQKISALTDFVKAYLSNVTNSVSVTIIEDTWSVKLHGDFKPLEIGEFLVLPEHLEIPENREKLIRIIPAQAFGTGQHETTSLMLELISGIDFSGKNVLDVGCGTGILGIAALLKGAASVTGIDIDPLAVENAAENLALNGMDGRMELSCRRFCEFLDSKWDFIFANIITEELIRLRPEFEKCAQPGTTIIFSGVTVNQEDRLREHFRFLKLKTRKQGEWLALTGSI